MDNDFKKVVILLAHPNIQESQANKMLVETVKDMDGVFVINLYEQEQPFNVDEWLKIVSEASAIIYQFPLHWLSAPSLLKKWQDEVFTHVSQTPSVAGKPLQVVVTAGSNASAYRSGGRTGFTVDELLRPYQVSATFAGMIWQTPIVAYGARTEDAARHSAEASNLYKERVEALLKSVRPGTTW